MTARSTEDGEGLMLQLARDAISHVENGIEYDRRH